MGPGVLRHWETAYLLGCDGVKEPMKPLHTLHMHDGRDEIRTRLLGLSLVNSDSTRQIEPRATCCVFLPTAGDMITVSLVEVLVISLGSIWAIVLCNCFV